MENQILKDRTKKFALNVIKLTSDLPSIPACWVIGKQVIKSSTSIGANYREACRARSKNEFIAKIGIVESESDETVYWLELLLESNFGSKEIIQELIIEANELTAIYTASGKTAKRNL